MAEWIIYSLRGLIHLVTIGSLVRSIKQSTHIFLYTPIYLFHLAFHTINPLSLATTFIVSLCEWEAPRKEGLHDDFVAFSASWVGYLMLRNNQLQTKPVTFHDPCGMHVISNWQRARKTMRMFSKPLLDRDQSLLSGHRWDVAALFVCLIIHIF